jgi:sugar lactone lactonase YvrE
VILQELARPTEGELVVDNGPAVSLVGGGDIAFTADSEWLKVPQYWRLGGCSDVSVDSEDRIWLSGRGDQPVTVWSSDGALVGSWGYPDLRAAHGIAVTRQGAVWICDVDLHVVRSYNMDGSVRIELGERGRAQATVTHDGRNGAPFNMPAASACDSRGRVFVADGYGNRRVHRFAADGTYELSWGTPGDGPGQFALVHGIVIDSDDRLIVCDRENNRVQFFSTDGDFIDEWRGLKAPASVACADGLVYVVEMGQPMNEQPNGMTVFTTDGTFVGQWYAEAAGRPHGSHGIAVDSAGNVYLADLPGGRVVKLHRS